MGHGTQVDIPEPLPRDNLDHVVHYHGWHHQHTLPGDFHYYFSEHVHHFVRQHEHEVCHFFWRQHHSGVLGGVDQWAHRLIGCVYNLYIWEMRYGGTYIKDFSIGLQIARLINIIIPCGRYLISRESSSLISRRESSDRLTHK